MASILAAALPFLLSSGDAAGAGGGLPGLGGLANILGGGAGGLGTMAGSTLGAGMQGPTQGSGIMGALSGGNIGAMTPLFSGGAAKPQEGASYPMPTKSISDGFITGLRRRV